MDPAAGHFTGSAFQILRSSKKPSLPMQPNSTFDFGCMGKDGFYDDLKVWNAEPVK